MTGAEAIAGGAYTDSSIEKWLKADERKSRSSRVRRIGKLLDLIPIPEEGFGLPGETSVYLFDEIRLAYTNGLFLSVVLLSLAFAEKQMAARLYMRGNDQAATMTLEKLGKAAVQHSIISDDLYQRIETLRQLRNAIAHFREPGHEKGIARRMIEQDAYAEEIYEGDADEALKVVADFIYKRIF
jgi:hypothetical protein